MMNKQQNILVDAHDDVEDSWKEVYDLSEVIMREPGNVNAYRLRGVHYRDMCDYQKAIDDLSEAIRLDPADAYGYGLRGDVLGRMEA